MPFLNVTAITSRYHNYLAALGRTIAVCQHLEGCAHHVMVVWELTDEENRDKGLDELRAIALGLRGKPLVGSTRRLRASIDFGAERAELLDRGRSARNWLVHESTVVIDEQGDLRGDFVSHLLEFGKHVRELCEADSLLATASYEI